jgi:hypothetical protein
LFRFIGSGFTDAQCGCVGITKTGSNPALSAQRLADGVPTRIDLIVAMVADNFNKALFSTPLYSKLQFLDARV